ncbi:hypothetical protein KAX02_02920 [candidate division WOR-3 bacterium]|nr:hypothetical protein [candidate division WOR-3 bacterium]
MLTKTDRKAIPLLTANQTQDEIAKQLNITQPRVSQIAHKAEVRTLVEKAQVRFIQQGIKIAISNQLAKVEAGKAILSNQSNQLDIIGDGVEPSYITGVPNRDILALADKVEARLMQSVGILPSQTPSPVYLTLIAGGNIVLVDPTVQAALQGYTDDLFDDDVQEAKVEVSP